LKWTHTIVFEDGEKIVLALWEPGNIAHSVSISSMA
jgi:hypothetical protein